jgi:hypothetical protein
MRAFVIAPLATPIVLWIGELILDYPGHVPFGLTGSLFVNLAFSLPVAYVAELVLGIPAWKGFARFGITSPFAYAAVGIIAGMVPVFFLDDKLHAGLLCGLAGAASALSFRALIEVRGADSTGAQTL